MEELDVEDAIEYRPIKQKNVSKCKTVLYTCICTTFILTLLYAIALTVLFLNKSIYNTTIINNNSINHIKTS